MNSLRSMNSEVSPVSQLQVCNYFMKVAVQNLVYRIAKYVHHTLK